MTEVLVFVPGLLGSELWSGRERIWPGTLLDGIISFSRERFLTLCDPKLEPGDIIRRAGGIIDVYQQWIDAFGKIRRDGQRLFSEGGDAPTLFVCPYDWRKDIRLASVRLQTVLRKVTTIHRSAEIVIVAHSLGGLVARHYLQSGLFDNDEAFGRVKQFVTFGTPHNGAPVAFAGILGKHKTSFLTRDQARTLANIDGFPSLYQTIPAPDYPFIWDRTATSRYQVCSPFDAVVIDALRLNPANIEAARAYRSELRNEIPTSVRSFLIMGTRQKTITHFFWNGGDPTPCETPDGGDGTVAINGALLNGWETQLVGQTHMDLITSPNALATFVSIFGGDVLAPAGVQMRLSVRDRTIEVEAEIHLTFEISPSSINDIVGDIILQHAQMPVDREPLDTDFTDMKGRYIHPIEYRGPGVTILNVVLDGVDYPGIYRASFRSQRGRERSIESPAFVVQS